MLKREWPDRQVMALNTPADIEQFLALLGKEVKKSELELDLEHEQELKAEQKAEQLAEKEANEHSEDQE